MNPFLQSLYDCFLAWRKSRERRKSMYLGEPRLVREEDGHIYIRFRGIQ